MQHQQAACKLNSDVIFSTKINIDGRVYKIIYLQEINFNALFHKRVPDPSTALPANSLDLCSSRQRQLGVFHESMIPIHQHLV